MLDVTVVVTSIPIRRDLLGRALTSVVRQTLPVSQVLVQVDHDHEGAAVTRTKALRRVQTEWVAFLDDDDELLPQHLDLLADAQLASDADVVHPWFDVVGGTDPFPHLRGRQFDLADPGQIPVTVLARTSAVLAVGGFYPDPAMQADAAGNRAGEDFATWIRMAAAGYRFQAIPDVTWLWHHDSGNTSGLGSRW